MVCILSAIAIQYFNILLLPLYVLVFNISGGVRYSPAGLKLPSHTQSYQLYCALFCLENVLHRVQHEIRSCLQLLLTYFFIKTM